MSERDRLKAFADGLREASRPAHRALDHHPLLVPLTRNPLSSENYVKALAALHGPQQAIERMLSHFAPSDQFPSRLADLERDLAAFGVAPLPLTVAIPQFQSEAQLIGAMYVIEGSNLGGAVIARQLALSLPPTAAKDFFANSGGPARWETFWRFAASFCHEDNRALIEQAACTVFGLYQAHLDRCLTA